MGAVSKMLQLPHKAWVVQGEQAKEKCFENLLTSIQIDNIWEFHWELLDLQIQV